MIDAELAALIVENALDYAVFTLESDGRIKAWSRGAAQIFGYSATEAQGMDFAALFLPSDVQAGEHHDELARAFETGRAEDTRWHIRKSGDRFWANGVTMRLGDRPELIKVLRDETPAKLAEDQRVLLLNELNHRIKNTLATVQSIAEQTLRASNADVTTRQALSDRLIALAEAHNVLVSQSWAGADLHAVLDRALAPHDAPRGSRFSIDGPRVLLSPQQAVTLSLVVHELTTNAIKYGALSRPEGRVTLTWNLAHSIDGRRTMTLLWTEEGGPPVVEPTGRGGFGTRLIARSFGADTGGRARLEYRPSGLRCLVEMPLSGVEEFSMMDLAKEPAPLLP